MSKAVCTGSILNFSCAIIIIVCHNFHLWGNVRLFLQGPLSLACPHPATPWGHPSPCSPGPWARKCTSRCRNSKSWRCWLCRRLELLLAASKLRWMLMRVLFWRPSRCCSFSFSPWRLASSACFWASRACNRVSSMLWNGGRVHQAEPVQCSQPLLQAQEEAPATRPP